MLRNRYTSTLTIVQEVINGVIHRKIHYQEIYENLNENSQIEDKLNKSLSVEPMEVDTSLNDSCDNIKNVPTLKQRFNSPETPVRQTRSYIKHIPPPCISNFGKFLLILLGICILVIIYLLIFGDKYIIVNRSSQFDYLQSDLDANLLSQNEAITVISRVINEINLQHGVSKILTFIGTTGVGKTFAVNILRRHFIPDHIHEIHKNNFNKVTEIINNLDSCCCNLIVIDNLKADDLKNLTKFLHLLPLDEFSLIIIPIFNVHSTTDGLVYNVNVTEYNLIRKGMDKLNIDFEWIIFHEPERKLVENWLRTKLEKKGVHKHRHDILINEILKRDYLKKKGFKGLEQKISLIDNN